MIYLRNIIQKIKDLLGINTTIDYSQKSEEVLTSSDAALFRYIKFNYFKSLAWKNKRARVLLRDRGKCVICHSTQHLHVHHMSGYTDIPNEPISCLVTLCETCHKSEHEKHGYPETFKDYESWNHQIPISRTQPKVKLTYIK